MRNATGLVTACAAAALLAGCSTAEISSDSIQPEAFGVANGKPVQLYTLRNAKGAEARIMTYGGVLLSLKMPDKNGDFGDVVLGGDKLMDYAQSARRLNPEPLVQRPGSHTSEPQPVMEYFGALIGRYADRINHAQFKLDGQTYHLSVNDNGNTLNGGQMGFDKVVWDGFGLLGASGPQLTLKYISTNGEDGFPGRLSASAVYTLTDDNALIVELWAVTDKDTVVNLTDRTYFNLAGKGNILGHIVQIPAEEFAPINTDLIPTGEMASVNRTPFDFRKPASIGSRIGQTATGQQLKSSAGYDQNWIFVKKPGELSLLARVTDPVSGRILDVMSTEPALQFFSGNQLDGSITGKGGWSYQKYAAFCMQPQHLPDSPNKPQFPDTELKPGETYHNLIIYKFSTL